MRLVEVVLPRDCERVEVLPLSDVHPGDPSFKADVWKRLLDWVLEEPYRFVVLNGDLIDAATRHSVGDPFAATMNPQEEKKWAIRQLKRLAEDTSGLEYQILGCEDEEGKRAYRTSRSRLWLATTGNHEERIYRDTGSDPSEDIAAALGVPYCGAGGLLYVRLGQTARFTSKREARLRHDGAPVPYTIYVTHGAGAGSRVGGKANRLETLSMNVLADVYVVGHTHQPLTFRNNFLVPNLHHKFIEERERVFVNSGSFLGWAAYAERKGLVPGSAMMPVIELDGRRKAVRVIC